MWYLGTKVNNSKCRIHPSSLLKTTSNIGHCSHLCLYYSHLFYFSLALETSQPTKTLFCSDPQLCVTHFLHPFSTRRSVCSGLLLDLVKFHFSQWLKQKVGTFQPVFLEQVFFFLDHNPNKTRFNLSSNLINASQFSDVFPALMLKSPNFLAFVN